MKVRVPKEACPPIVTDAPTEPLTPAKLRRLAGMMTDLAETIEAVGLTESTRADVDHLRLTICHYMRWEGLHDDAGPRWLRRAKDALTQTLIPVDWCYASSGGKHTTREIAADLRRLAEYAANLADIGAAPKSGWTPEEEAEIAAGLRTLAAAVDGAPLGHDTIAWAARLRVALVNVYGEVKAPDESLTDGERSLLAIVGGALNLLREIQERRAPADAVDRLLHVADGLATAFAETARLLAHPGKLLALADAMAPAAKEPNGADPDAPGNAGCKHSTDFTEVIWFGKKYKFSPKVQAKAVEALWREWETTGLSMHQQSIGKAANAEDGFRMDCHFRKHQAFGTMIRAEGDGRYRLCPPEPNRRQRRQK